MCQNGKIVKWVELPSGWFVPGSCVYLTFDCCLVNCCGGLLGRPVQSLVHLLRNTVPGHHKDCQIGSSEQQVHLQPCVAFGVQSALLAGAFLCPVCRDG